MKNPSSSSNGVVVTCATMAVIILIVLCGFGAWEYLNQAHSYKVQLQNKAQLVIGRISDSAEHALWGMDTSGLQSVLAAEMGDPDLVNLLIKEGSGQDVKVTLSVERGFDGLAVVGTNDCSAGAISLSHEVVHEGKVIGLAIVNLSDASLKRQLHATLLQNVYRILTLLACILPSLFWVIRRNVVRPIVSVISNLDEEVANLGLAAASLTSRSQSLAEGASEQAASLEETSSSLEEMSSMTKNNAENAGKATDLAKQARQAADKGVIDIQEMSAAMASIKTSSNDIAKIIKTIDEIAFQTNILALNAAVEAARAGEAGMGFAVVADEVRNLAQRSAQAAKETAAKIEGAIAKTGLGVEISRKVSETLNEIVTKARQVDELVSEVAGASREQTQGITQVNTAVGQMDKVTQSNAANAEESAAAAQELNAQAVTMKESVAELLHLIGGKQGGDFRAEPPSGFQKNGASRTLQPAGVVKWNEERMSTGVASVDEEHKELIKLINDLHAACVNGTATENLMSRLDFLGKYAQTHFAHEENIMAEHQCPASGKNKAAHTKFLHDYQSLVAMAQSDGATSRLAIQLKQMLADWLTSHICKIDTNLRDCHTAEPYKTSTTKAQHRRQEITLEGSFKDF